MPSARFIQIHWLASYPGALLNRDDAGLAKRLPFGGVTRGRVSSQSLKRHWRLAGADSLENAADNSWALQNLEIPMGFRTKLAVENKIMPRALEKQPTDDNIAKAVEEELLKGVYAKNAADPKKRQTLYFGESELEFLAELAAQALAEDTPEEAGEKSAFLIREQRANLRALKDGAGLGAALFGRMVTSDPAANTDAAIHVAHALTVHKLERDLDYMTVVDDLKSQAEGDDSGSAGIFDMELTSGLYYGYVVVDIGLLVSNLAQDREIAAQVVEHLVHLIAQVSPGAKKGSTAPYAWAELMLIEAGARQPRTLANAFRDPVDVRANGLLKKAVGQMNAHLASLDAAYGGDEVRCQLAVDSDAALSEIDQKKLDDLAQWTADVVRGSVGATA
ncbi:MAG: type I-E CRISPR-associated protein Cas7/Cse4/CasC [Gemmatimonadetes bacterium]|nr:type I-E CRISPR-associated protein Cas7/Cse4/CasC [Gemmatimonadota bacterium]